MIVNVILNNLKKMIFWRDCLWEIIFDCLLSKDGVGNQLLPYLYLFFFYYFLSFLFVFNLRHSEEALISIFSLYLCPFFTICSSCLYLCFTWDTQEMALISQFLFYLYLFLIIVSFYTFGLWLQTTYWISIECFHRFMFSLSKL